MRIGQKLWILTISQFFKVFGFLFPRFYNIYFALDIGKKRFNLPEDPLPDELEKEVDDEEEEE